MNFTVDRTPELYGLLYVGDAGEKPINMRRSEHDPIAVYVANALTLSHSAQAAGMSFTLVTNAVDRVRAELSRRDRLSSLRLREHRFTWDVPVGIPFRSTHFKLELLGAMGREDFAPVAALIDLDVVVLRPFALRRLDAITSYDMTDHVVPAYGPAAIVADLAAVQGRSVSVPAWFGGGFIGGSAAALRQLADEIEAVWPRYLARLDQAHHVGDDMVVSAAIGELRHKDFPVCDAAADGLMGIYWSSRTLQPLPPLDEMMRCATLHLPADKSFLAQRASRDWGGDDFARDYVRYARRQRWIASAKNVGDALRGRRRQALPRLKG